jgi:non-ribosomal peptide synthetase component F
MVVLRVRVPAGLSFAELVERVRTATLAAWDHQEMPFQKLVETLATAREPGVPPLYQLGFNHLTTPGFSSTSATAEDDLMLEVCGNSVRLEYNTGLFEEETARLLADDYVRVLAAGLADPATAVDRLPVLAVARGQAPPAAGAEPGTGAPVEYVAPRTAAEELVAQVWAEVLGARRVGALDDFFDLGGHSLLALRVIARLSGMAGTDLPIHVFFADTTVAGVAAALEGLLAAELDQLSEEEALRLVGEEEP